MHKISIRTGSHLLQEKGPVIEGAVTHSNRHRLALTEVGKKPGSEIGKVLLDTGASSTCLDRSIAKKLGLKVVDIGPVFTPSGTIEDSPRYEGQVFIDGHPFHVARACEGVLANQGLIALIGRDILSRGKLEYDGRTGIVTFRF